MQNSFTRARRFRARRTSPRATGKRTLHGCGAGVHLRIGKRKSAGRKGCAQCANALAREKDAGRGVPALCAAVLRELVQRLAQPHGAVIWRSRPGIHRLHRVLVLVVAGRGRDGRTLAPSARRRARRRISFALARTGHDQDQETEDTSAACEHGRNHLPSSTRQTAHRSQGLAAAPNAGRAMVSGDDGSPGRAARPRESARATRK